MELFQIKGILYKNKIVPILIANLLFFIIFTPAVFATEKNLNRGTAAALIYEAALSYNKDISVAQIIKGYEDGKIEKTKEISRIEAYVMIARAFGNLAPPEGHNLRTGVFIEFKDIPDWANQEISTLKDAGIVTEQSNLNIGANDKLTREELSKMINRVYFYVGTNQKDNLYATINAKWLNQSAIPVGYSGLSAFDELELNNKDKLRTIVTETTKSSHKKGSDEQKIADFYNTAIDKAKRNEQGIEPIKKYLVQIDKSQTMDELLSVDALLDKETGVSVMVPWSIEADAKNSDRYAVYYSGALLSLDKDSYLQENENLEIALKRTISKYLTLSGEEEVYANELAEKVYKMEKDLAFYDLNNQDVYNVNMTYNPYSIKDFVSLFKGFDMGAVLDNLGLDKAKNIIVFKKDLTLRTAELMNNENLDVWKAMFKYKLMNAYSGVLSEELENVSFELAKAYTGSTQQLSFEEKALDLTTSFIATPIEKLYVNKYFSKKSKKDVEKMATQFLNTYESRVKENNWLSEQTKQKAIKKLNKMTVKIGYPDKWPRLLNKVQIDSYKDGGSLFKNVTAIMSAQNEELKKKIGEKVDKDAWGMNVYEVNAYYNPLANEIVFPAGILQAPFYDENGIKEKNLGGIGTVIAHEITHAFDNNGANYDEDGNANNWWTVSDYANFEKKCKQVISLYDKIEVAPGIENNGELTVSENVADLGGLACALSVAEGLKEPNYNALIDNFTTIFRVTRNRTALEYYSKVDVHSNGMLRVNQAVKNFEEFYRAYNIDEDDGMYLPPEERIIIW